MPGKVPTLTSFLIFFTMLVLETVSSRPAYSDSGRSSSIAILPFEIISKEDISYIQSGVTKMLYSRLEWKDHLTLIDRETIAGSLKHIDSKNQDRVVKKLSEMTGADFVISGSLTQFANAFSIDAKIYDIKNKRYMPFFEQSNKIDDIIPKINALSARINQKVFNRKTSAWEKLARQEKEEREQIKRQNPEQLMPITPGTEAEKPSSFWKIWEYL